MAVATLKRHAPFRSQNTTAPQYQHSGMELSDCAAGQFSLVSRAGRLVNTEPCTAVCLSECGGEVWADRS